MTDDINATFHSQVNEVLAATLTVEDRIKEVVHRYHAEHGEEMPWQVLGVTKYALDDIECYTVIQVVMLQSGGDGEETLSLAYACHCDLVVRRGDDFVVVDQCSDERGKTSF